MPRQKKKPEYDPERIMQELMKEIVSLYVSPEGRGGISIRQIADEFDMTSLKVRKLLITAGVFSSEISEMIHELHKSGKSVAEIQNITSLSRASVHSYLPYKSMISDWMIQRNLR